MKEALFWLGVSHGRAHARPIVGEVRYDPFPPTHSYFCEKFVCFVNLYAAYLRGYRWGQMEQGVAIVEHPLPRMSDWVGLRLACSLHPEPVPIVVVRGKVYPNSMMRAVA